MKKPINLNHLRVFVAIARAGSFGGAAKLLGVSQPTLSLQLSQLEEDYGVRLVNRPGRPLTLTSVGEELLMLVAPLTTIEQAALALLQDAAHLVRGRLRIAADAPQHVLGAMARFAAEHEEVELSLTTGNSEQVLDLLLHHRADVAVVADVQKSSALYRRLLHRDRVVVVVNESHVWATRKQVSVGALGSEVLIEREPGSRTRTIVRRALQGVTPAGRIELSSREAVLEATALGLGVGFVFESELADQRLHPVALRGADMRAEEFVVTLRPRRNEATIGAFIEILRAGGPAQTHSL